MRPRLEDRDIGIDIDALLTKHDSRALNVVIAVCIVNALDTAETESFISWIDKNSFLNEEKLLDSMYPFVDRLCEYSGVNLIGQFYYQIFTYNVQKALEHVAPTDENGEKIDYFWIGLMDYDDQIYNGDDPFDIHMSADTLEHITFSDMLTDEALFVIRYGTMKEEASEDERLLNDVTKEQILEYFEKALKPEKDYLISQ